MSYFGPYLDPYDLPHTEPESYCVVFTIPLDLPHEIEDQVKAQKLTELYGSALANLGLGRPYAITIDYARNESRDPDGRRNPYDLCKWSLRLESVRTQIVEVPRIEEPHYKLPKTDSLKERAAAAWNYIRGKGVLSP